MTDDASERPNPPQPTHDVPEWVRAKARELARLGRGLIRSPATEIESARSGLLSPPHTPSGHATDGDQTGGAAKARHPAEEKPLPSPSEIARDPQAYLPPQPAPGRDRGRGR